MGEFYRRLLSSGAAPLPASLLWVNVISDLLIVVAFLSIPITLIYISRRLPDRKSRGLTIIFAGLVFAGGVSRAFSVWTFWHREHYWGIVARALTAAIEVTMAVLVIKMGPAVLRIREITDTLQDEIEARKRAEERLHAHIDAELLASEDKLRSCFEAASQAILGVAINGRISLVNRRTEEMFGYSREELLGQELELLLPERFRGGHVAHRDGYFNEPRVRSMGAGMELAGRRKDGTEFPIEIGLSHVITPEGPLAFGMVSDITERRKAEAELLASEDKLRSCFEAASQAILGVSSHGRISLVNRRTEEMFGYSREELLGQELELLLPERFRGGHVAHRDGYFNEPRVRSMGAGMELAGRRKDGTEFPIEIGLSHVVTPEGPLAFGMVSDISEQRKAAGELKRVNNELRRTNAELVASQDKLRSYFEAASQAILGVSSDGRISLVNHRTEEMFGYTREELVGKELELLLPERFRRSHVAHRDGYFAEPRVRAMGAGMDLAGRRKDGTEFPIEIGLGHAQTPEGPLAFGMVSDISERKKAADDLKRANEDLRRSNTEMEQFAHVASHDLQEPLRMVTGYLQLIERRYTDRIDATGKEFIGFAVDGAKRMKVLIRDLLEFSRAGTHAANFSQIDTNQILNNALANLKTAIDESGVKITIDTLPAIVGDPVLLTQVFQNLIANAIKFQKGEAPAAHISARRRGVEWIFSVRDNGIGIESHHLERIFRIFERLHSIEEYSGSGIGLAITRKIVERHRGRIWVESELGAGSTFFFSLTAEMEIANNDIKLTRTATS